MKWWRFLMRVAPVLRAKSTIHNGSDTRVSTIHALPISAGVEIDSYSPHIGSQKDCTLAFRRCLWRLNCWSYSDFQQ